MLFYIILETLLLLCNYSAVSRLTAEPDGSNGPAAHMVLWNNDKGEYKNTHYLFSILYNMFKTRLVAINPKHEIRV